MTRDPNDSDDASEQTEPSDQPGPAESSADDGTNSANDGPNGTWLGVGTALVVPIVGVLGAVALFAIDFDPRDALLIGLTYLLFVTIGTGLYMFATGSERPVRLLRTTGGFAAALFGVSVIVVLTADTDLVAATPIVSQPVPLFIYVYAVTGALGYVFTVVGERRLTSSDKSTDTDTVQTMLTDYSTDNDPSDPRVSSADRADQPIKPSLIYDWSIRVLAAIPLASAVFLLVSLLLPQSQFGATEVVVRTADGAVSVNETGVSGQLNETSSVQDVDIERRRRSDRLLAGVALLTGLFVNTAYTRLHDLAVRLLSASRRKDDSPSD